MTEDPAPFPGEEGKEDDPAASQESEDTQKAMPQQKNDSQSDPNDNPEKAATNEPLSSTVSESQPEPPADPPESQKSVEETAEESPSWAAFSDDFPKEPVSSLPRVVEVEVKESKIEPKKSSLDIEDRAKSKISLGESNESPVTPEELDMHNLAKLESLKESDA
jgi:hypothetical protein